MSDIAIKSMQKFLGEVGIDIKKMGLEKTPARVYEMYKYLFSGVGVDTNKIWGELFASEVKGIVIVKDIPFYSMCEHHLLPFFGKVSIAYLPHDGMVAGFSKFTNLVEIISHRPQLQERMTNEIAEAVQNGLKAEGVLVIVEAVQLCMCMRGDCANDTKAITSVGLGSLEAGKANFHQAWALMGRQD